MKLFEKHGNFICLPHCDANGRVLSRKYVNINNIVSIENTKSNVINTHLCYVTLINEDDYVMVNMTAEELITYLT